MPEPLDRATHVVIKDERTSHLTSFLWRKRTHVAGRVRVGLIIVPSPLLSPDDSTAHCRKSPGRRPRTCDFDRIYGRGKKQERRGGGGLMHYLQLKLERGPLRGLTQRLVSVGLCNKDRHLWILLYHFFFFCQGTLPGLEQHASLSSNGATICLAPVHLSPCSRRGKLLHGKPPSPSRSKCMRLAIRGTARVVADLVSVQMANMHTATRARTHTHTPWKLLVGREEGREDSDPKGTKGACCLCSELKEWQADS